MRLLLSWVLLAACSSPDPAVTPDAPQLDSGVPDASSPSEPDATAEKPDYRVLFIGNSYTHVNELPTVVASLAEASQSPATFTVTRHTVGSASWWNHDQNPAVTKLIAQGWDYVVLQDQSTQPWATTGTKEWLLSLDDKISSAGGETVLFMTWARGIVGSELTKTRMNLAVNNYYERHGAAVDAEVAAAGRAWEHVLSSSELVLHDADGSHPNERGTYLTACVVYAALTDVSPVGLGDGGLDIPADERALLQQAAWDIHTVRQRSPSPAVGAWPLSAGGDAHDLIAGDLLALGDFAGPDGAVDGATNFGDEDSDGKYAAIPFFRGINAAQFTLAFYGYREDWSIPTAAVQTLFAKSWGYELTQDQTTLKAVLHTKEADQPAYLAYPVAGLADGWHHFALTYDGSTYALWVDAERVAFTTTSGDVRYYETDAAEDLRFNGIGIGGPFTDPFQGPLATQDSGFSGALSDVRLFDRALDQSELAGL